MSKLIDPGAGEISDRLSILALKILFATEGGRDTTHFQTEHTALLSKIRARTLNGVWFDSYTELAAVNAALWHAEDDLREWRNPTQAFGASAMEAIRRLAFRIQDLNDKRAGLIERINKSAGDHVGGEKLSE